MSQTTTAPNQVKLKKGPAFVLYKGKKSKPDTVSRALRALTMNLRVGQSEARALEIVGEQYHKFEIGRAFEHAAKVMRQQGASLQQALLNEDAIPRAVKQMISASNTSQSLHENLARAADIVASGQSIKKKLLGSLIQPAFMIALMVAFLFVAVQWIIPGFVQTFAQLGSETPVITQWVLKIGDVAALVLGTAIVALAAVFLFWAVIGRRAEWFRNAMDLVLVRVPAVGPILKMSAAARLFELLSANIVTGLSEPEALKGASNGCGNAALRRHCHRHAEKMLRSGVPLKDFASTHLMPIDAKYLLASAPSITQEIDVMNQLAPEYNREADLQLTNLTRTIEPLVNYFVYGAAGLLIVAVMLPMYSVYPLLMNNM